MINFIGEEQDTDHVDSVQHDWNQSQERESKINYIAKKHYTDQVKSFQRDKNHGYKRVSGSLINIKGEEHDLDQVRLGNWYAVSVKSVKHDEKNHS